MALRCRAVWYPSSTIKHYFLQGSMWGEILVQVSAMKYCLMQGLMF